MRTALLLMLAGFLFFPAWCYAAIIHVPGDYNTIQAAIDAASPDDTVLVAPGTYMENLDFLGKAITVTGSGAAEATIIDGGSPFNPTVASVVSFVNGEGADSVLDGFTLRNGRGTEAKLIDYTYGGGIYCVSSSPTITGNIIRDNETGYGGGGIYCIHGASPEISSNFFVNNKTVYEGSGICCRYSSHAKIFNNYFTDHEGSYVINIRLDSCPEIRFNTITENQTGGLWVSFDSIPLITDNVFTNNEHRALGISGIEGIIIARNYMSGHSGASEGGAVYCFESEVIFIDNEFVENSGEWCGAVYVKQSTVEFDSNIFTGNVATDGGAGALSCRDSTAVIRDCLFTSNTGLYGGAIQNSETPMTLVNNMITGNVAERGGALYVYGSSSPQTTLTLINNTMADNEAYYYGSAIYCDRKGHFQIVNSILFNKNTLPDKEIMLGSGSVLDISYSILKYGQSGISVYPGSTVNWGPGMMTDAPEFIDAAEGDYHIAYTSNCCNAGTNGTMGIPAFDFEGDPRIQHGTADLGADEHSKHIYGHGNLTPGGDLWLKVTDLPGTAPVLVWVGVGLLDEAIETNYGDWYLELPILLEIPLVPVPADGVISLYTALPPDLPAPLAIPLQALAGTKLTNAFELEIE